MDTSTHKHTLTTTNIKKPSFFLKEIKENAQQKSQHYTTQRSILGFFSTK